VVFTKYDAHVVKTEAKSLTPSMSSKELEDAAEKAFLDNIKPQIGGKTYVCLSNMQKEENQCPELTETTAEALRDNTVLAKLFIITSRNNTAIRRKMCIQEHVRVRLLGMMTLHISI